MILGHELIRKHNLFSEKSKGRFVRIGLFLFFLSINARKIGQRYLFVQG
jgi:hypothetical protein